MADVALNKTHIPALDGLRGLACLLVLIFHAGCAELIMLVRPFGYFGVILFFTLSGFLMHHLYAPGPLSWRYWLSFLVRRVFRLYPLLIAILLLAMLSYLLFALAIYQTLSLRGIFRQLALIEPPQAFFLAYTIIIEMKFYIFLCFLSPVLLISARVIPPLVTLLLCWCWAVLEFRDPDPAALSNFLCYFVSGMIASELYRQVGEKWRNSQLCDAMALFCLGIFLYATITPLFNDTLFSLLAGMLIFSVICGNQTMRFFSYKPMRFVGTISYAIYLTNSPIFWLSQVGYAEIFFIPNWIVAITMVFLVSILLYELIEKPCISYGNRLSKRIVSASHIDIRHQMV